MAIALNRLANKTTKSPLGYPKGLFSAAIYWLPSCKGKKHSPLQKLRFMTATSLPTCCQHRLQGALVVLRQCRLPGGRRRKSGHGGHQCIHMGLRQHLAIGRLKLLHTVRRAAVPVVDGDLVNRADDAYLQRRQIGRASCRERV